VENLRDRVVQNESKTEIIVFAPSNVSEFPYVDLGPLSIYGKSMVKNLGVILITH